MSKLQTLDRGIIALKLIANSTDPMTIAVLAERLKVDRAIVYRIVSTLEEHRLVRRGPTGMLSLDAGVYALSGQEEDHLRMIAKPILQTLSMKTNACAFITVADGDQCRVLSIAEPEEAILRVGYRVGVKHSLKNGAAGLAILSGRPQSDQDSDEIIKARKDGYILTRGQIQKGAVGVASPLPYQESGKLTLEACIGVVAMDDLDVELAIECVNFFSEKLSGKIF